MSLASPAKNNNDVKAQILQCGVDAKNAFLALHRSSPQQRSDAVAHAADLILQHTDDILEANRLDVLDAQKRNLPEPLVDRLALNQQRIQGIADAVLAVSKLPDPVGDVISSWETPGGLHISRVREPLGVIAVIFESRPNVTADAASLCLRSGNAVILRPGSDSIRSSRALHQRFSDALSQHNLPAHAVSLFPSQDRRHVGSLLQGLNGAVDVLIPRGGPDLVRRVSQDARVPVFAHLEGVCHVFVDKDADADMAINVALNSKMRRTSVCGAAECLLIHDDAHPSLAPKLINALLNAGCQVRGDQKTQALNPNVVPETPDDLGREFLDAVILIRHVSSLRDALQYIAKYGSSHTDAVITNNPKTAETFLSQCNSAITLHNASTQFADGGQFGMGAEIGIATGRIHARGPVGAQQLTTFRYQVRGRGQIRP